MNSKIKSSTIYRRYTFSLSNIFGFQSVNFEIKKVPKFFVLKFKIIAMTKICITFYQVLPLLITPYHNLLARLERKPFCVGNFKISSKAPDFLSHLIMPRHSLSHLIPQVGKKTILCWLL